MKTKHILLIEAAILPLLVGCASQPVTLSPVGPDPAGPAAQAWGGCLKVFSDTEPHEIGDSPPYYPHMGYNIYDESGKRIEYVPNHLGCMDESPTLVNLPAGDYKVVAESSSYGRVTVPVVIEGGKTTVLHLDRDWRPSPNTSVGELVQLPDGEAVGWSAP